MKTEIPSKVFPRLLNRRGVILTVGILALVGTAFHLLTRETVKMESATNGQGNHSGLRAKGDMTGTVAAAPLVPDWEPFDFLHNPHAAASFKVALDQKRDETIMAARASAADANEAQRQANRQSYFNPFSRPIPVYRSGGSAQSRANAAANREVNRYRQQMSGALGAEGIQFR